MRKLKNLGFQNMIINLASFLIVYVHKTHINGLYAFYDHILARDDHGDSGG